MNFNRKFFDRMFRQVDNVVWDLMSGNVGFKNDVVTVKLVGGDEIIGKLTDDNILQINKPLLVVMAQQGFGFLPYIVTGGPDSTIEINEQHVISVLKTYDPVAKEYIKQTTNILMP